MLEWQSVPENTEKPREDPIKTPFHFYVNWLGKTARRLERVCLTTHMIIYLTIFSSFHNNCTCTITTIFISQRTFANVVNYLAFLVTLYGKALLLMVKYSSLTFTHFKTLDDGLFIRLCTTLCSTFTTRSEIWMCHLIKLQKRWIIFLYVLS